MANFSTWGARCASCCVALLLLGPGVVDAHVELDSPVGGESLSGGFVFPIDWHVAIQHNTEDWDLWYSTVGDSGPWVEIVSNLPKGDTTPGAEHSYDWHVPNSDMSTAWVRVRQDNGGEDYYDVSGMSFGVAAAEQGDFTGNGVTNDADLSLWEGGFGTSSGAFFPDGDDDSDSDVDGIDFLRWQGNYSSGGSFLSLAVGVPEPSALLLLLLGSATALLRRR